MKYSKLWVGAELLLFVLVGASVRIDAITAAGFKAVLMIISLRHLNIGIFHPSFSVGTASKILVMTSHYSVFFLARRKNSGYKISDI